MIPAPTLPWFEIARFRRSRLTRLAVIAVMLVPLFYGALYIWANIDPTGHLDRVKAAVVNHDKLIQVTDRDGDKQPIAVGRQLAGNLISDDSGQNYDWELTDADEARRGLADGHYKAVLTIPENLSVAATSTAGDPAEAIQGRLVLQTNDAVNYINGNVAKSIMTAARSALNAQVTETYLDNVYLTFSDVKRSLTEAGGAASTLAEGADKLHGGLSTLESKTSSLPSDTRRLADGARQVSDGVAQINALVQQVGSQITGSTDEAKAAIDRVTARLEDAAQACRDAGNPAEQCAAVDQAAQATKDLRPLVDQASSTAGEYGRQTQELADGADKVARGNAQLAKSVPALTDAIGQASDGAGQLSSGTRQLSSALSDGADKVPDYDTSEREHLAKTAATPFTDAVDRTNAVDNYGEALTPYFMALALWVGAMAIYLLLRPLSHRAIASTAGSVRTALAGFAPGVAIAAIQAVLLLAVVEGVLGVHPADQPLMLGMALATAVVFTAINQMFIAVFGAAGRFLAIVFVCLQLTAAGGTYPIETAPGLFGFLHGLLPMTYAVHGFRAATAGGSEGVGVDFFALAVFTLLALTVTIIAARRRQTVTMTRLHPTLVV